MIGIDINMPKSCDECILADKIGQYFGCPVLNKAIPTGYKSPDCPLHSLDNEIRIGDEVYDERILVKSVVWRINGRSIFHVDTRGYSWVDDKKFLVKTGRHFDEVEALLKRMKGKEE